MYFLDSNICIDIMRGKLPYAYSFMTQRSPQLFAVPSIVVAELYTGVQKSKNIEINNRVLDKFLLPFQIIPFDERCATEYGCIRADLEQRGCLIGANDLLIAACTKAHHAVLVSNNIREFKRIKGLQLESWALMDIPETL